MNYQEIKQLNELLPGNLKTANLDNLRAFKGNRFMSAAEQRRFHLAYTCPSFGWSAAEMLHEQQRTKFPMASCCRSKSMRWVYKAFVRMRLPERLTRTDEFLPILDAFMIFDGQGGASMKAIVEAVLLTQPESLQIAERKMGLRPGTLEAYDALFYSVADRREDHMLLCQMVYPNTRLEEHIEDYLTQGRLEVQLKRMAYNKGLDSTLFFAGFRQDLLGQLDEAQASNLFKRAVMIQATLLADHGFLNFTRMHPAILSGKALVQSRMLGGQDHSDAGYNDVFSDLAQETLGGDSLGLQGKVREKAGLSTF